MAGGQRHISVGPRDGYHFDLEPPEETRMFTGAGQVLQPTGNVGAHVCLCMCVHVRACACMCVLVGACVCMCGHVLVGAKGTE